MTSERAARRVLHDDGQHTEAFPAFPPAWAEAPLGVHVASTQLSIVLKLLLRIKKMLGEVWDAGVAKVATYVLTLRLSQSQSFQLAFYAGVKLPDAAAAVKVSGRTGPLRYKTSVYGALINAISTFEFLCLAGCRSAADLR
jgi:hypothetical protein